MSYTYATPMQVSKQRRQSSVKASELKDGMKIKVQIDKQTGDDEDRTYIKVATVANCRVSKPTGRHVHFDIADMNIDESMELSVDEYIQLM